MHTERENRKAKIKSDGSRENAPRAEHEPATLCGLRQKRPGFDLGLWDLAPEAREGSLERGEDVGSGEQT